jgi:hypothetical protein
LLPKRRQIVENGVDQASASIWASVLALALALDLSMFWLFRCFIPVDVLSVDVLSVDVLSLSTFSLISSFDLLSVDVLSVDVLPWSLYRQFVLASLYKFNFRKSLFLF